MSLEPYIYRAATPDTGYPSPAHSNGHSRNTSGSSLWSSPDSSYTYRTTPSPIRQTGPTLIPKVRPQDQGFEPEIQLKKTHRRALSSQCNPPEYARSSSRPRYQRSTTSPPDCSIITPISVTSSVETWAYDSAIDAPIYSSSTARGSYGHGRSTSTPGIDASTLRRYGNPTYRTLPVYTTRSPQYTPAVLPGLEEFVPTEIYLPAPATYRELTPELVCSGGPTTTIIDYLSEKNQAIRPVEHVSMGTGVNAHCWWDIRNLRVWKEFDLDTITSIPGFTGLLNVPVEAAALPYIPLSHAALRPSNERALQDIITRCYAARINAAIKTSQLHSRHITMRPEHSPDNGPYYVSSYANDITQTLSGRGRVVGLVKSYNVWNTGMRHEKGTKQVQFLAGLAHVQRLMREHNTRYGFIITEIELICVRMGIEEGTPYFGLIEVSDPIELRAQEGLTAGLALWYLHMLTGDFPLAGQCGWKVDIGPPAAMTRSKVLQPGLQGRDKWMAPIQLGEMRSAKTRRGWAMPEDKLNRKREHALVRARTSAL